MAISIFYGAKILGLASDWTLTLQDMQHLLFVSEYIYAGRHKAKLFNEEFYVFKDITCVPLYQELYMYKKTAVEEYMFQNIKIPEEIMQSKEVALIIEVYNQASRNKTNLYCLANVPRGTLMRARKSDGRMTLRLLMQAYEELILSTNSNRKI